MWFKDVVYGYDEYYIECNNYCDDGSVENIFFVCYRFFIGGRCGNIFFFVVVFFNVVWRVIVFILRVR